MVHEPSSKHPLTPTHEDNAPLRRTTSLTTSLTTAHPDGNARTSRPAEQLVAVTACRFVRSTPRSPSPPPRSSVARTPRTRAAPMPTARSDDGDANGARLRKPRRARRAGRVRVRRSKGGCVCACGADVDRAGGGVGSMTPPTTI